MNLTVDNMRDAILKVYANDTWEKKVKGMSDAQVMAIFYNFVEHGKIVVEAGKQNPRTFTDADIKAALAREEERVRKIMEEYGFVKE